MESAQVRVVDYDPEWPRQFRQAADRIQAALGDRALRVEHAGSTAVPGLAAKPVIDIVLEVADTQDETLYAEALERAGFRLIIREPEWFGHRLFKGAEPEINLHVFPAGCAETGRMLAFRDWLRDHEDDRDLYARTKRELAQRDWARVQDYADAKTAVVAEIFGKML